MVVAVDIHRHPSFYSPGDGPSPLKGVLNLAPWIVKKFNPIPALTQIVNHAFNNNISICAISACHTPTSGIDNRFSYYLGQTNQLAEAGFDNKYNQEGAFLAVSKGIQKGYVLYSQEVRTRYGNSCADINVLGVHQTIQPARPLKDTIKEAKDLGGIVIACHPNIIYGMKLNDAIQLYQNKQIDAIEGWNASIPKSLNEANLKALNEAGVAGRIAVTDSHHYADPSAAGIALEEMPDNPITTLKEVLPAGRFNIYTGQLPPSSVILHHHLPIIESILEKLPFLKRN